MVLLDHADFMGLWSNVLERFRMDGKMTATAAAKGFCLDGNPDHLITGMHHIAYYFGDYDSEDTVFRLADFFCGNVFVDRFQFGPSYIAPKYYGTPGWWMSLLVDGRNLELFIMKSFGLWKQLSAGTKAKRMSHYAIEVDSRISLNQFRSSLNAADDVQELMYHGSDSLGHAYVHFLNCRTDEVIEIIHDGRQPNETTET